MQMHSRNVLEFRTPAADKGPIRVVIKTLLDLGVERDNILLDDFGG